MSEKNAGDPQPVEEPPPPSDAELEAQEQAMKSLLSGAKKEDRAAPPPPLLAAVQRKIRARSKGKFYADGWSVEAGGVNTVLVAAIMLVVLAIAYFALGPVGVSK